MPGASSLLATGISRPSRLQTGRTGQPTYRTEWRGGPRVCVRRVCVCQASVCALVCVCVCACVSLGWVGYVVNIQGSPAQPSPALLASSGDFTAYIGMISTTTGTYGRTNPACRKGQPSNTPARSHFAFLGQPGDGTFSGHFYVSTVAAEKQQCLIGQHRQRGIALLQPLQGSPGTTHLRIPYLYL